MAIVKLDNASNEMFEKKFDMLENGIYNFEVANDLKVEPAKKAGSTNKIIKVELRCVDDAHRGSLVFDTIVLAPKSMWKLAQFAVATGAYTKEQLVVQRVDIDLNAFKNTKVRANIIQSAFIGSDGQTKINNKVKSYLFT